MALIKFSGYLCVTECEILGEFSFCGTKLKLLYTSDSLKLLCRQCAIIWMLNHKNEKIVSH